MFRIVVGYIVCLAVASWRLALVDQTKTLNPIIVELSMVMLIIAIFTFVPWLICVLIGISWRLRNRFIMSCLLY